MQHGLITYVSKDNEYPMLGKTIFHNIIGTNQLTFDNIFRMYLYLYDQ